MVDSGRVVGIVTASDITRLIDVRRLAMPQPAGVGKTIGNGVALG